MGSIFISYRREDSGGHAGRLRDNLRARFAGHLFQDVDGIADGEIFENILEEALSECQVAAIVIGRTWLTCTDEYGRRRLDDPEDWVRIETRMLLGRSIRVIPVLVGGATMPRAVDLPEDLRALVKRQSRELRDMAWDADVAALSDQLGEIIATNPHEHRVSRAFSAIKKHKLAAGGAALAVVVVVASTLLLMLPDPSDVPAATAATPTSAEKTSDAATFAVDLVVDQGSDIDESLLVRALIDVQRAHIVVTRLLDSELGSGFTGTNLDVDEIVPAVLRNGELRSPDNASYTVLVTNRRLSRPTGQLDNLFYFAHHRFGILSVRNFDDEHLAILIGDTKQGERVELLRKYLTAFIPLTAFLGQADARKRTLISKRGPGTDRACLSDYSNDLRLLIYKLRSGPVMCPEEYDGIASTFGPTIAADYKAVLDQAAK